MADGDLALKNTNVTDNSAILYGGGIYLDGGNIDIDGGVLSNNAASSYDGGQAVTFDSGTFTATGLRMGFHSPISPTVTGGSQLSTTCTSPCAAGEFGVCEQVMGTSDCFVNCVCGKCPAGKVSSVVGATSDTCSTCGAGLFSAAGDTACSSCAAGKYASDDPMETGGGLVNQISLGASSCNECPAGWLLSLHCCCGVRFIWR